MSQPRPRFLKPIALVLAFSMVPMSPPVGAAPGSTAASFLKVGAGARGAAMGNAQSALADDPTAAYWNPAGLSQNRFQQISVMYNDLAEGVRYSQGIYAHPTATKGTFAFGVNLLDYGSIQGFDESSLPTGQVDAKNWLLTASWGKRLSLKSPLAVGASFKYLSSELAGFTATSPLMDLGLLYPFEEGSLRGLRLAATLRHIGPGLKYDRETSDLPQQFVLGAALAALGGNLNVALDAVKEKNDGAHLDAGIEYRLFRFVNLRAGLNGASDFIGNGISYGLGLHFTNWDFNYALVPFGELGTTNRVSVNVRFGRAMHVREADEQVANSYRLAERQVALGRSIEAFNTLNEILLIAPWHKPSVELKARIQQQFEEMAISKNRAKMDAQIADSFTSAKAAFDRDELIEAKKGFETILQLQPEHVGSTVYLERIKNRYRSLAFESFKQGMNLFAAGDYVNAKTAFEKTLTIDPENADAKAQLEKTNGLIEDATRREKEISVLAGAGEAYKQGLAAYQKNDWETALVKFQEVKGLVPEYEEVGRYLAVTQVTLAGVLFEQAQVNMDNGQLEEAVAKLKRAHELSPEDERIDRSLKVAQRDADIRRAEDSRRFYKEGLDLFLGGQTAKAQAAWKKALELDPSNEEALKALQKVEEQKQYENTDQ